MYIQTSSSNEGVAYVAHHLVIIYFIFCVVIWKKNNSRYNLTYS